MCCQLAKKITRLRKVKNSFKNKVSHFLFLLGTSGDHLSSEN